MEAEKLIFKSEKKMQQELRERISSRKPESGRDGYIISAEGKFTYRNVAYLIKVLRYFNHTDDFTSLGRDRVSHSHAVVEYPDETKPIVDLIPNDYGYEFLYHDTLHSNNDKQTIEEQIKECHELAKEDIDSLIDGEISKKLDEGIMSLQNLKDKLNHGIAKLK